MLFTTFSSHRLGARILLTHFEQKLIVVSVMTRHNFNINTELSSAENSNTLQKLAHAIYRDTFSCKD